MDFRLQVPISKSKFPIDYDSKILSLGSCFAENMSQKFEFYKFQNTVNPFGIIFNPVSIEKLIQRTVRKDYFTDNDVFFHNDLWHCFEVHSELSNPDKQQLLDQLNGLLDGFCNQITQATHFVITLGTAWVYRSIESNAIVANCHKVPQKQFTKKLLSVETIVSSIQRSIDLIQSVNPNCNFIFTVSPVRHIKDGFFENNISKASLLRAIYEIVNTEHFKLNTEYFCSYEIMMDELRDYRFYAPDMLHPSQVAIDYIWERFKEATISESSFSLMKEVQQIQTALLHRPINPNSESHQQFVIKNQKRIETLTQKYPFMVF
ncbi:GSCFA domain-containing protein [Flavobacterium faecale]|uniref:GSCFA domain-containing protein n=1 Tax=Flavobacterium faecale TaxID=1355330 RepID=UPI003AAC29E6